jgi:hypothetical protein
MTGRVAAAGPYPKLGGDARELPTTLPAKRTSAGDRASMGYVNVLRAGQRRVTIGSWGGGLLQRPYGLPSENKPGASGPLGGTSGGPVCAVDGIVPAMTKPSFCVDCRPELA